MPYLSSEEIKFYKENGFIKLSDIFSDAEMDEICEEYNFMFESKNNTGMEAAWLGNDMKKLAQNINYSVKSIHALQFHSGVFSKVILNKKLLDALEDIMNTKNILLHHTKAHFKPPENGAPYLMHQDYHYFPFRDHSMVAVFLHLDDTTPENGGLCVYPGSHKLGPQEDKGVEERGDKYHYLDQKLFPLEKATPISAKRGEIIIFSYLLIHGSYLNLTKTPRRMFLIQLMSAEDEPMEDVHRSPGQGMVLRGRNMKRQAVMAKRFEA